MQVSAKTDYALRAMVELAGAGQELRKGEWLAERQAIPLKFLEAILLDLKSAQLVDSRRGPTGGYYLAQPADRIALADVIRAVDGPLANIHGRAPEDLRYPGAADALREVWIAVRAGLRVVLEGTTLADVVHGDLPDDIRDLAQAPDARMRRPI